MPNYYRTKILTSIKSLDEISLVLKKGVDIIDFKDPSHGALGEIPVNKISFFSVIKYGYTRCFSNNIMSFVFIC